MDLPDHFKTVLISVALFSVALLSIRCSSSPPPGEVKDKGGKIKLCFTPEVGAVSKYKGSHTREKNFSGMDISLVTTYRVVQSVKAKTKEGNNSIRIKCLEQDTKMVHNGETLDYKNPVKAEGKTIEVEVSPMGEVKGVKGFISGLSKDDLKSFAENWFFELPEKPYGIGESWQKEINDSTENMVVKGISEFTLEGIESKDGIEVACISGSAEMDIVGKSERGTIKGTNKTAFKAKIAIKGGYIVTSSSNSEMKGKMTGINPETAKEETRDIASFSHDKVEFIE
ncbi:hypothetical protein J7M07_07705 [bacterium]|nr:hypothetical protein [bacterium]